MHGTSADAFYAPLMESTPLHFLLRLKTCRNGKNSSRIDFCQQILHRLIDYRQEVAVGEQDLTLFINKHIGPLRHAQEAEGVVGFGGLFFGIAQQGKGKLVAFGKAFMGSLAVRTDAEHHNTAFGEFQNIVPVVAQLGGADRGVVTGIEDDQYFFSGKVRERDLLPIRVTKGKVRRFCLFCYHGQ